MIRLLIRIGIALLGAAIGFIVAAAVLDGMTLADLIAPMPMTGGTKASARIKLVPGLPGSQN